MLVPLAPHQTGFQGGQRMLVSSHGAGNHSLKSEAGWPSPKHCWELVNRQLFGSSITGLRLKEFWSGLKNIIQRGVLSGSDGSERGKLNYFDTSQKSRAMVLFLHGFGDQCPEEQVAVQELRRDLERKLFAEIAGFCWCRGFKGF